MSDYIMEGAELASKEKSMLRNKLVQIMTQSKDDASLHLSEEQIKWWKDCKLGLFIHWGAYAVIGKGEWAYFNEKYDESSYMKEIDKFKPNQSPEVIVNGWLDVAENAGMKYAVMVTRHHDGFSMWDSKGSWKDYTSVKYGPHEDYVHPFVNACHNRKIHTGLYYSPMDWRFPGYFNPKGDLENALEMKKQCYAQVEELCRDFGKIEILWYDGGWLAHEGTDADSAWLWEPIKLNKMARSYQPSIMVTPRSGYRGDFQCDEGPHEVMGDIITVPWEKCMTISTSWGYRPNDKYFDSNFLINMLINTITRGGNLLLNVGPDINGNIDPEGIKVLNELGVWVKKHERAIYGTRAGYWQPVDGVFGSTHDEKNIYLFILNPKEFEKCKLNVLDLSILSITTWNGDEVEYILDGKKLTIHLSEACKKEQDPFILKVIIG